MKIEKKDLPRAQVEVVIELTLQEYEPFLKKAALEISESVKIDGFRPGKAPYEVIKKQVGEAKIWEAAIESAVQKTLFRVIQDEKLETVGSPKIDIVKLAPGNPVVYKAVLNIFPKVKEVAIEGVSVKKKNAEVDEKEFDKALNQLRNMRAKEVQVSRAAKKGDKVEVDFEIFLDNVPVEGGQNKNMPIILGEKHFLPGFEEELIGVKEREEKEFPLQFPEQYHHERLAGKTADFKVKVLSVFDRQLPELNDEFAKELRFQNVEDLKNNIRENLKAEEQQKAERELEDAIMDKVIEKSSFGEIPDIFVQSEAQTMMSEMEQKVKSQGIDFDDYLKHIKKDRPQLLLDFAPQAMKRVKGALLFREIAKRENIGITDKEVDTAVEATLQQYGDDEKIRNQAETPEYKNYIRHTLTSQKVMAFLKKKCVEGES